MTVIQLPSALLLQLLVVAVYLCVVLKAQCPPANFDAVQDFNVDEYISARWYSIKQIPVSYQPLDQFNCVTATYTKIEKKSFFCRLFFCTDKPRINVFNSARKESTTGKVRSINLLGVLTDIENEPAKVYVTFPILPNVFARGSNYWVVKTGKFNTLPGVTNLPAENDRLYDWAIITTALPDSEGENNLCYSNGGMWIFSYTPTVPTGAIEAIETIAKDELGLDISQWKIVDHTNCVYDE